jgi:hypothetical protein
MSKPLDDQAVFKRCSSARSCRSCDGFTAPERCYPDATNKEPQIDLPLRYGMYDFPLTS